MPEPRRPSGARSRLARAELRQHASGVGLADTLTAGFTWSLVSVTPPPNSQCTLTSPNLTCSFGDLGPGATRTVVVTATTTNAQCKALPTVNGKLSIVNDINGGAVATATNADPANDPGLIVCERPTITVVKTPDGPGGVGGKITAGDNATFTIVVTNTGTGTATGVQL